MAKVLKDGNDVTHLRGAAGALCCDEPLGHNNVEDGTLTCPDCAAIAIKAIETSTKAERKEWRKL